MSFTNVANQLGSCSATFRAIQKLEAVSQASPIAVANEKGSASAVAHAVATLVAGQSDLVAVANQNGSSSAIARACAQLRR